MFIFHCVFHLGHICSSAALRMGSPALHAPCAFVALAWLHGWKLAHQFYSDKFSNKIYLFTPSLNCWYRAVTSPSSQASTLISNHVLTFYIQKTQRIRWPKMATYIIYWTEMRDHASGNNHHTGAKFKPNDKIGGDGPSVCVCSRSCFSTGVSYTIPGPYSCSFSSRLDIFGCCCPIPHVVEGQRALEIFVTVMTLSLLDKCSLKFSEYLDKHI